MCSSPLTTSTTTTTTTNTTTGEKEKGAVLFKFTDPALNARAATVKDQLLQWAQSKTVEYEVIIVVVVRGQRLSYTARSANVNQLINSIYPPTIPQPSLAKPQLNTWSLYISTEGMGSVDEILSHAALDQWFINYALSFGIH